MRKKVQYIPLRDIIYKVFEEEGHKISHLLAKVIANNVCEHITEILDNDKDAVIGLPNLGRFSLINVRARKGRNPQNGGIVEIPEHSRIKFKLSSIAKKK